jgi:hypothetical protein
MSRGVRNYLVSSVAVVTLVAVAGCSSRYLVGERESWRRDAETACLNSGAVQESATRVRISSIDGPGMCGISYPLKVSSLGESVPLGYDDEPLVPPGAIPNSSIVPNASVPQHWPIIQSGPLPPVSQSMAPSYGGSPYGQPQPQYGQPQYGAPPTVTQPQYAQPQYAPRPPYGGPALGAPLSLYPPGVMSPAEATEQLEAPDQPGAAAAGPYYGTPSSQPMHSAEPNYPIGNQPAPYGTEPLGPPAPAVTASVGPVGVKPPATLACPIVSVLDQWITGAVQPAAQKWFRQPVVEIKQISSYSCRGMNGDPNAHISEHAFGNALDIAEFTLTDGHKVSVQYGWHGTPEEQGFLHDVQAAACDDFTTVLAPGANVYHYNHIHVDLMRHYNNRHICEPAAISGDVAAARAGGRYAGQRYGDPGVTGSIVSKPHRPLAYSGADDEHLPLAVPGED